MGEDAALLAAEAMPFIAATATVYRGAVLAGAPGESDEVASLGCRLLVLVFGACRDGEPLPGPLEALAADPGNEDAVAAVRLAVRQVLAADPGAAAEVRSILGSSATITQRMFAGRDVLAAGRDLLVMNINHETEGARSPGSAGPAALGPSREDSH